MHILTEPSAASFLPSFAVPSVADRREDPSDLEVASRILAHAVQYLVSEQLAGRRSSLPANRDAIALLCDAGRKLAIVERRAPARRAIAGWLRGSALVRALRPQFESFH